MAMIELREFTPLPKERLPSVEARRHNRNRKSGSLQEVELKEPLPQSLGNRSSESAANGSIVNLMENNMNTSHINQPHWMHPNWFTRPTQPTQSDAGALRESFAGIYRGDPNAERLAEAAARGRPTSVLGEIVPESPYEYYERLGALGSVSLHHAPEPTLREARTATSPPAESPQERLAELEEAFCAMGLDPRAAHHAARGRG